MTSFSGIYNDEGRSQMVVDLLFKLGFYQPLKRKRKENEKKTKSS